MDRGLGNMGALEAALHGAKGRYASMDDPEAQLAQRLGWALDEGGGRKLLVMVDLASWAGRLYAPAAEEQAKRLGTRRATSLVAREMLNHLGHWRAWAASRLGARVLWLAWLDAGGSAHESACPGLWAARKVKALDFPAVHAAVLEAARFLSEAGALVRGAWWGTGPVDAWTALAWASSRSLSSGRGHSAELLLCADEHARGWLAASGRPSLAWAHGHGGRPGRVEGAPEWLAGCGPSARSSALAWLGSARRSLPSCTPRMRREPFLAAAAESPHLASEAPWELEPAARALARGKADPVEARLQWETYRVVLDPRAGRCLLLADHEASLASWLGRRSPDHSELERLLEEELPGNPVNLSMLYAEPRRR